MRKLIGLTAFVSLFLLCGCLDTIEETTLNEDGTGVYTNTADMSKIFAVINGMGGAMGSDNEKLKDLEKIAVDTVMLLKDIQDSSSKLTAAEKKLIEKGTARLIMNYKQEKFTATYSIPFSKPADIIGINDLLKSSRGDIFEKQMKNALPGSGIGNDKDEDMAMMGSGGGQPDINNYFDFTYERSKLKKKVNKERYANAKDDKDLQSLQEMGGMGMPVNFKTIINLPKPAKKAEGKGVKLSDDRKKITIEGTIEDFLEDASQFEYEIEF